MDTYSLPLRLKKPYVELIEEIVRSCSCTWLCIYVYIQDAGIDSVTINSHHPFRHCLVFIFCIISLAKKEKGCNFS